MARVTTQLITMSDFHQSPEWAKLSADFKKLKCVDCGKSADQAGHILPASRFKLMRLWKSNLVNQCAACNAKLGSKIRWSWQAIKLLGIYAMIKILTYLITILTIALLARYYYLDTEFNNSTITNQIKVDADEILTYIIDFAELSHAQRH